MSSKALSLIPPGRRDRVFDEIRSMVNDIDAQDRSLLSIGEGMEIDEVLEDILDLIANEVKLARKRKRRFKAA